MKPTTKFLSVIIATQIAFSCFASAVESTKTAASAATATKTSEKVAVTKEAKTTAKKVAAKKSKLVKKNASKTKNKNSKTAAGTIQKNVSKNATTAVSATSKNMTAQAEPKEAIESEIETIDQMEAAAKAEMKKGTAVTPAATAVATTSPTTTSTTATPAKTESSSFNYNLTLGATYNTAAEAPEKGDRSQYMTYDIIPSTVLGPVKLLVWFSYNQNLVDSKDSEWQDFPIAASLAKPYEAGTYITLNPALVLTVPQTRATKDKTQLNYSINTNVTIGLNTKNLGWDGVVLNWQTGYTKMNNDFTTSSDGEPITDYRLRQRVNFWYPIYGNFNFKSRLQFDTTFSYENQVRNAFLHFVAVEYKFLEKYNVNFGTTNAGPTMAPQTYENNFKFYNSASSELFLGFGADF